MAKGTRTRERTERIEIRCTPTERQAWETQAAARGCSLSALIRHALGKSQAKHIADPTLVRQLASIGNNLNQVARWCNTYKEEIEARLILAEIQHIRSEMIRLTKAVP